MPSWECRSSTTPQPQLASLASWGWLSGRPGLHLTCATHPVRAARYGQPSCRGPEMGGYEGGYDAAINKKPGQRRQFCSLRFPSPTGWAYTASSPQEACAPIWSPGDARRLPQAVLWARGTRAGRTAGPPSGTLQQTPCKKARRVSDQKKEKCISTKRRRNNQKRNKGSTTP